MSGRPRADRDLPPPPSRGAGPARPWSRRRSSSSSGRSRSGHGGGGAATPAPGEGGAARGLSAARAGRGWRGGSGGPGCQARSGAGRDEWARQGAGPPSAHRARARRRRGGGRRAALSRGVRGVPSDGSPGPGRVVGPRSGRGPSPAAPSAAAAAPRPAGLSGRAQPAVRSPGRRKAALAEAVLKPLSARVLFLGSVLWRVSRRCQ